MKIFKIAHFLICCYSSSSKIAIHATCVLHDMINGITGGHAEVELLPDDLRLFYSGYFWLILANPDYFLATVWLILATLG